MQTSTRTSTHIILILFVLITLIITAPSQAKHWKIMPVGDSITKGEQSTDFTGFRKKLFDKLNASGVDFEFVGDDIGPDSDPNYRGFFESGAKIDYFLPGGTKDLMAQLNKNNADIVLIHLGTNNMNKDAAGPYTDPTTASGKLYDLLNDLTQRTDLNRIVVCKIIPKVDDYGQIVPKIQDFNAQIEQMFFDKFANDIVTISDMNSIIDVNTQMSYDGIHPNDDGYQQMANMYSYIIQGINNNGGLVHEDTTPPGQISWVKGESLEESAYIEWYVPADDGSNGDRANLYELRYSTNELDESNFGQGTLVSRARPGEPGSTDSETIDGLVAGLTYHFAIRAYDEQNNSSILSANIPVSISEPGREVCDDFSDPSLLNWQANPAYQVANDELENSSSSPGWNYLAVFTEATYNSGAGNVNASFTWSSSADVDGINATGIAMLLDKTDYSSANGYLVRIRERKVYLETIVNGQPQTPQLATENFDANAPDPQPGDTLRVSYSPSTTNGYVFNVYINKNWVGQVQDTQKTYGQADHLYSGVMLYGNMNNNIDNFCVSVPPLPADHMAIHGGDGTPGTVTEKLSEPLSVKVMDVNDIGVQDIQVEFSILSGDAFLSTDSLADKFNGQIWVEAESGTLIDPMINYNDGGASGNAYISTPTVNGNYDNGLAKYKIYFPVAGSYNLWVRYYAPNGDQNSCYYAIENIADTTRWDFTHVYTTWDWDSKGPFTMPQGFVDFTLKNREPGTRIDKILFTNNLSYQPSGEGGTSQRFENITDASGIAYTELTFGEQAGQVQVQAYAPSVPKDNTQVFAVSSSATDPSSMDYVDAGKKILTGTTGQPLDEDFSVFVQDQYHNPNNGIPVTFTVVSGDGHFDNSDGKKIAKTIDGIASARLILGSSAETKVTAELKDYPNIPSLDFYGRIPSDELASKIVKSTTVTLQGQVKTTLNDSLKVQVLNDSDQPVSGYNVTFSVTGGGGTLNGSNPAWTSPTNAGGYAAVAFTLGDTAGVDNQIVQADGSTPLNGAPITFTASATHGPALKLVRVSGNNQQQYAGQTFAEPLKVKVTDAYSNGIENYSVRFQVVSGNGNFAGQTGTTVTNADTTLPTDSLGVAQIYYTAGNVLDMNQVQASASGLSPGIVTFDSLKVLAPRPSGIEKISGDDPVQRKQILQTLDSSFKVLVYDTFNQPVTQAAVVFKPLAAGAKISGSDTLVYTNPQGEAEAKLTLGTVSGRQATRVYIKDRQDVDPVEFYADADPGPAAKIFAASDTSFTGIAGRDTVELQVRVTDQYDNPIHGFQSVQFYATNGGKFDDGNTFKTAVSDNIGKASVKFIMGTNSVVTENIRATASLSGSPVNFYGTVLPDSANAIPIISGQNQVKKIESVLDAPLVVEVRDRYDNPIANESVVFEAHSRGGRFETDSLVVTDNNGRAQVTYRLGTKAGDNSDTVSVYLQNRRDISNVFYASATPGEPEKLAAVGDTLWQEQLGPVQIELHPQVKVTDNYDNPVSGIQVAFQPAGSVDPPFKDTDNNGTVTVTWKLSISPDTNRVAASAVYKGQPLVGSPVHFMAITEAGNPRDLQPASAQIDTGFTTLKVKVLDENGHPVKNQPVTFKIKYPASDGGQFVMDTDTLAVNQKTVYSNEEGIAKIGYKPAIGINSVEASNTNVPYSVNFTIYGVENHATKITLVNATPILGVVDSTTSIQIKALDIDSQPVAHQSLSFKIITGSGKLESENNTSTNENGIGEVRWRLGKTAGQNNNSLQVTAKDGNGAHLARSPMTIAATALAAAPFPDSCRMQATDNIVADGSAFSAITITLHDRFGNPVQGDSVILKTDSTNVTFAQPDTSNAQGQVFGSAQSTKADSFYVYAVVPGSPEIRLHGTIIHFIHGDASRLQIYAGNNQPGNAGAVLKDSLAVKVIDENGNVVPGYSVPFVVQQGGILLENSATSFTAMANLNGIAFVHFIAGNQVNTLYKVKAQLPGNSASSVSFTGQIREAKTPFALIKISPDTLWGQAGELLDEPLLVKVLDVDSIPVANKTIDFEVGSGTNGEITNITATNYLGIAAATYKLGRQSGDQIVIGKLNGASDSVRFLIKAQSGRPVSITAKQATKDTTVGQIVPLTATIHDSSGIGVPNVPVEFTVTVDGYNAKFIGSAKKSTDSNGNATVTFQVGEKVGDYIVRARSDSLPGKWADFHINAVHDKADSLKIYSGNKQYMEKGQWLNEPVVVQVTDRFGNPVDKQEIFFSTSEHFVDPTRDTTDVNGLAESHWRIGTGDSSTLWALATSGGLRQDAVPFVAYGVSNHFPDFDGLPTEVTLDYTAFYQNDSTFSMKIKAQDADGEPITYTVVDIPAGANYDKSTHMFSWKPGNPDYKGIWTLRIKAEDSVRGNAHGVRIYVLKLNVTGNIPPTILGTNPPIDGGLVTIDTLKCQTFTVTATDPDNDPLTYFWEVDGIQQAPHGESFTMCAANFNGDHSLRCIVYDGIHEVSTNEWIINKVELSSFSATSEPYKGIIIDWSTASESSNLGFNILRSQRENGTFEKLNAKIIPSREDGSYSYSDTSAAAGVKYYYKLEDVSTNGYRTEHGPISVQVSAPDHFALLQNYPNPFNPQTSIRFQLPQPAETRLIVFNYLGQEVRTLVKAKIKAGYHEIIWDGRNNAGLRVSSGIYYYRIIAGDFKSTKKMALIK